jgi:quercetin dioxygenase-like cupin family protein
MKITRAGSTPSAKGPEDYFTGTVRLDRLFAAEAPGRVQGAAVTFEPGARTAWHTHPLGQTIIVTSGLGRAQREGGPVEEIRPGRRGLVRTGREALARRGARGGDDASSPSRKRSTGWR